MPIGESIQDVFLVSLFWNFFIFMLSYGKMMGCNGIGMWGLFWYNDNGEMMNNCFNTAPVGANAEYIPW